MLTIRLRRAQAAALRRSARVADRGERRALHEIAVFGRTIEIVEHRKQPLDGLAPGALLTSRYDDGLYAGQLGPRVVAPGGDPFRDTRAAGRGAGCKARRPVVTARGKVVLRISMGVHSGPFLFVLAGEHQRELFVLGEHATTVTDMESTADAGEILISTATAAIKAWAIRGCGPTRDQMTNVNTEIPTTMGTK